MPDPSRAIYHVIPPQIPQSLFNLYETAKANIREITGLNEAYLGENVGSLQTSQGVNSLIERATMRDRDQLKDLEDAVENITRLLVAFITTKYDAPRFIRISGSTPDEYEFQEFLGKDYFGMEYDYSINVSQKHRLLVCAKVRKRKNYSIYKDNSILNLQLLQPKNTFKTLISLTKNNGLSA